MYCGPIWSSIVKLRKLAVSQRASQPQTDRQKSAPLRTSPDRTALVSNSTWSLGIEGMKVGWVWMVRPEGVEPPTYWFVASCSIQLSYGRTLLWRQLSNDISTHDPDQLPASQPCESSASPWRMDRKAQLRCRLRSTLPWPHEAPLRYTVRGASRQKLAPAPGPSITRGQSLSPRSSTASTPETSPRNSSTALGRSQAPPPSSSCPASFPPTHAGTPASTQAPAHSPVSFQNPG